MSVTVKGSCVDVLEFKCPAFCNLRVFDEGHQFDRSTSTVVSSNRYGMTVVASSNQLSLISMKHVHQLVGDFGVEKNTLTEFLKRIIELDYSPNFLDLSCDEEYLAVAGTSHSVPSITIYNVESLISQSYISVLVCIKLEATHGSSVIDMSWNPGVQNSLACCLSDGSLFIIELKDGGNYTTVSLPPQSSTLCLSWSPKGKQIIIGSSNGFLTQYKPELKAVKQYSPPTDMNANVNPIKVKWISNFQFAVVYDNVNGTDEQPSFYILNTPKNAPFEFINFEQYVIMNSEQYRSNQYYTIFQHNWNLLFVASSNCTEIGVMGMNPQNQWQCWVLETRPELPYRLDKQIYPIGMSLDLSSQMRIKQLSKSNEDILLEPMPVLCVLSSDGILFMYHIENQLSNYNNICKPPTEMPNNVLTQLFTTDSKVNSIQENGQVVIEEEQVNVTDLNARGDQNESVLASYLETSTTSQPEQPQISFETQQVSVVKPNVPVVSTAIVSPVQNSTSQSNHSNNNESAEEAINQVMLKEVLEDVQMFQSQLQYTLQLSNKTSELKVGDGKDKETLVKKWTSLDAFFKELNETNRSEWVEIKALQKAVLDCIAWIEDSKSRLFFLKNPKYKCLLKSNDNEPFSKTLFDSIERTLYYVETQLTHVDDQLKARYNSYNPTNKDLKIPNLETIYKSLVMNTNIVNKLKEKINCISNSVEEVKYRTYKNLSLAPDVVQNSSRLYESRDVGLSKLSEQLLKITLDKDGVSAINSYNVAKKYSVLSANQRALSDSKVSLLQEWLKDFKTRRTKIGRSEYANIDLSRPVCSTPLKSILKQKNHEKNVNFVQSGTEENVDSTLTQLSSSLNKNCNGNNQKTAEIKLPVTTKADLSQFIKPLFVATTQQTNAVISPKTITLSSGSTPLHASTSVAPFWNPVDNTSTPKPHITNVFSATNSTPLFGNNFTLGGTSIKDPVDYSVKMSKPLNFSKPQNTTSTKSTLDIISSTTESKEKTPFNFTSFVPATKTETTVPKINTSVSFNFTDSIKDKMSDSKSTPLGHFKFEMPKTSTKPLETPETFSGLIPEDKSKVNQQIVPAKEVALGAFNFNSKPDLASFSSFSFSASKDDVTKSSTLPETKSLFTSTSSTAVSASFNFSLPAKIATSVVSEPIGSPTISSTFGNVKTTQETSTLPTVNLSTSITETSSRVSESPTPIISEPVTPENENASTPTTVIITPVFDIPSTNGTDFSTPISLITTSTAFDCTTSSTSQKSIFNNETNSTGTPSVFNTPTNTTSASSIFITPTIEKSTPIFNTSASATCTTTVFGTSSNTNSTTSIFGTLTNPVTTSSIFGTQTNVTTKSSIFGSPTSTVPSSIFLNPLKTTASSLFGTSSATTASSIFGSATTTNTGGFGSSAQVATVFGSPASTTSSSIFGNPSVPASSNSIFGSTSTTSSIFGTPATTSSTTSIFGSPSTTSGSSGLFGSVAAAANQPSTFGQSSLGFNSPGSAFGNMSLFGQACSPSQPANNFAPPANPFAINKSPSNTSSLFSNQKAVFGQPAASTSNTGFGVANTGFGSSATSGFGSPSMTGQSSFGSSPMFGSMGTPYDMSKSSGFGQAPVFGGAATFGSPSTAQYTFGQNSTAPDTGSFGFGAAAQQPSTAFASLAAQSNSPSFGNVAQNPNAGFASPTSAGFGQTSPFKPQGTSFGGTSFSSWR